ncbi:MAG TPA: DUF1015 domain-containing protein [Thermodesulfobacteriota bacterium]|nr:DUF1015 domain-containing protein [Thermodesulfobacteriota bacterium]
MALVLPFRGISYDSGKVGALSQVVAPPYDVISAEAQDALYRRHPQNVIRLILNKETPQDNAQDNRYSRSAAFYRTWLQEGILVRTPTPHFYFLQEEFGSSLLSSAPADVSGQKIVRQGFIGLVRLEEYSAGVVLPHEKTQTKPRADRLALMEACQANFSQIFSLYPDEEGAMASVYHQVFSSKSPAMELTDDEGVRRKLWMVGDPAVLRKVTEIMGARKIFIADGHHRYETALAYREKQRRQFPQGTGRETYHFTMMYLSAMEDKGLFILPTHRVVHHLENFQASSFLDQLRSDFSVRAYDFNSRNEKVTRKKFLMELASRAERTRCLGMLLEKERKYFLLSLKEERVLDEAQPGISPSLRALDVNLLHILVFQKRLKIGPRELAAGKNVHYFKEPEDAAGTVKSGEGQIAFFLNPTKVYQVRDVSLAGETMPSKSTFFYPKLLSGLVINPLDPHEEMVME